MLGHALQTIWNTCHSGSLVGRQYNQRELRILSNDDVADLPYYWYIEGSQFIQESQPSTSDYVNDLPSLIISTGDVDKPAQPRGVRPPRRSASVQIGLSEDLAQILVDAPRCSSPAQIPYTDGERPYVVRHEP